MTWGSFKKVINLELILKIECITSMGINAQTICVSSRIVLKKITIRVFLMKASVSNLKIFSYYETFHYVVFFSLTLYCLSHSSPVIADFLYLLNE